MPLTEEAMRQARLFVLKWNADNPTDIYWRREFNVPFGSPQHLAVDFIDQQIWLEEKKIVEALSRNPDATIDKEGRVIITKDEDYGMTEEEIVEEFEKMDISELKQKYGKR